MTKFWPVPVRASAVSSRSSESHVCAALTVCPQDPSCLLQSVRGSAGTPSRASGGVNGVSIVGASLPFFRNCCAAELLGGCFFALRGVGGFTFGRLSRRRLLSSF